MPAVRITNVIPIASSPVIDTWRITLNRFTDETKRGSSTANTAINTSRKINGAKRASNVNASKPRAVSVGAGCGLSATTVISGILAGSSGGVALSERHQRHQFL